MIVGVTKATQIISMSDLVFLSNTIGVILVGLIVFFTDSFSLTQTTWVWSGIATICILFVFGQLSLFAATKTIGSAQTSLMLNIEPLVSILAAVILLGESLVLSQTLGVTVILVALVLASATQQGFSFFKKKNR
jgi:drug/metabolite transporter (DMT)-like permease